MDKLEKQRKSTYIYTYTCTPDEVELCNLEQRALFGDEPQNSLLESTIHIDPSRSPFITGRLDVIYEGSSLPQLVEQVSQLSLGGHSFKVAVHKKSANTSGPVRFEQRREIEREVGLAIRGRAEFIHPERVYGVMIIGERWIFGEHHSNESMWFKHMHKPQAYSTALSTRVARAVVNIAVPRIEGVRAIDPCCGIGTVLVEALSMGIDIVGRDINPLVTRGARENIAHFGFVCEVTLGAIQNIEESYDVAIIDLPYNLLTMVSPENLLTMLESAASFAQRVVVITIEPIDPVIERAGLVIIDRGLAKKGLFARQIIVCERH
jgi:tRNA G10  N-methylase Trm11